MVHLFNHHVFTQGFKTYPVCLQHGNGNMACFAGIDILHRAAFAGMRACNYFAVIAVF